MLTRRKIIQTIFGMTTTPALIAPQPKGIGTGEQKKYIMIVMKHGSASKSSASQLLGCLRKEGFRASIIYVHDAPDPIRVIDLSNLPEADLAEVRRMCGEVG